MFVCTSNRLVLMLCLALLQIELAVAQPTTAPTAKAKQEKSSKQTVATPTFEVAGVFSDNMVLQRDKPLPVWGMATPGDAVTVQFAGKEYKTTADAVGQWRLKLDAHAAGTDLTMSIASGESRVEYKNVAVGEVWFCSGQSNMQWPLKRTKRGEKSIKNSRNRKVRLLTIPNRTPAEPLRQAKTPGWQVCSPKTSPNFSAVAFHFGRELEANLDVPIGLINSSWGGTPMEAWTSREALASSETFIKQAEQSLKRTPKQKKQQNIPAALFNGKVAPVIPYAIRGAIWYQGESNSSRAASYRELSELMIEDWRKKWQVGDFPFLYTQLSAWEPGKNWEALREAQTQTLEVPNTGMVVTTDIGQRKDIHPRNKFDVGRRLALIARARVYGEKITYSGPVMRSFEIDGAQLTLTFDHVDEGLRISPTEYGEGSPVGELRGFEIAGPDGKFVPATATIEAGRASQNQVVLTSEQVTNPTAARYNWTSYPEGDLFNAAVLPAGPFRTNQ